jgi:hypothetical protein
MVHARMAANAFKAFLSISSSRIAPDALFPFRGKLYILVQHTLKTRAARMDGVRQHHSGLRSSASSASNRLALNTYLWSTINFACAGLASLSTYSPQASSVARRSSRYSNLL